MGFPSSMLSLQRLQPLCPLQKRKVDYLSASLDRLARRMWDTSMIAGKKSDVGVTFKKGGSKRNYARPGSLVSFICTGIGKESSSNEQFVDSNEMMNEMDELTRSKPLPSLIRPKAVRYISKDIRFGVKSTIGNDVTFAKGGSKRYYASPTSQIQLITEPLSMASEHTSIDSTINSAYRMHRTVSPDSLMPESFCHGKSSNVGFESTFAKGGNRRNYATTENNFPLPCLLASKFLADEESQDEFSALDFVPPISPTAYPIQYNHTPMEMNQSHGRKSNIGNDITFSKGGSRRIFAGPRSQIVLSGSTEDDDLMSCADTDAGTMNLDPNSLGSTGDMFSPSLTRPNTAELCSPSMTQSSMGDHFSPSSNRSSVLSPSSQLWLEANNNTFEHSKKSFFGRTTGKGSFSVSRRGQRRNFSAPAPQVSLKSAEYLASLHTFETGETNGSVEEKEGSEFLARNRAVSASTSPLRVRNTVLNGVKSQIGVTVFTGGHRKLFQHPESQILLCSVSEKKFDFDAISTIVIKGRKSPGATRLHSAMN